MNHTPAQQRSVQVAEKGRMDQSNDHISAETPIALVYNGVSHVVLMATPTDITELALGFSFSENIIQDPKQIYAIEVNPQTNGIVVNIELASAAFMQLKHRRRQMSGRTGCGLCGIDSLSAIEPNIAAVPRQGVINLAAIQRALTEFNHQQKLHKLTGSVHGAAWANLTGEIVTVREDVGRHNALDKIIGWGLHTKVDWKHGFVVLSSRASFEVVMKSALTGIGCVVAVSAPTTYAIDLAQKANITLVGFARHNRQVIYTHPHFLHF